MKSHPQNLGIAIVSLLVVACTSGRTDSPQRYVPITQSMQPLGELLLGNRDLQLTALKGQMKLDYVGIMPDTAGEDLAGASIYRVKNSDAFFKANTGTSGFCAEAPRWVAVNSENGAPAWSNEIWVGMLTLEDWAKFTPPINRVCISGTYIRTAAP